METVELEIEGVLSTEKYTLKQLEDMFFDWLEENEIYFGGIIGETDEENE